MTALRPAAGRAAALAASGVLLGACSGCGSHAKHAGREVSQLARSGGYWFTLSTPSRFEVVRFCKAPAGIAAARGDRSVPRPYFSDRYRAVQRLAVGTLTAEISRFFAVPTNRSVSIQYACSAVAKRLTTTNAAPRAVFAPPAVRTNGPVEARTTSDHLRLTGSLTAPATRVRLASARDHLDNGAESKLSVRGLALTLSITHLPVGRSYLELVLEGRGTRNVDALVIEREAPAGARSFAPITLSGAGSRSMRRLDIPAAATLSYRADRPGFGVSDSEGRLHLATAALAGEIPVERGVYRNLQIVADGAWRLVIAPR